MVINKALSKSAFVPACIRETWEGYVRVIQFQQKLICHMLCVYQRFGPADDDYYYKKSDEPQPDSPQDPEGHVTLNDYGEDSPVHFSDVQHTVIIVYCKLNSALLSTLQGAKAKTGPRKRETSKAQKKSDLELKVCPF